jgi:hypothetical protein
LPSISKNVQWLVSPMSSMSTVRRHFCAVVTDRRGGTARFS